MSDRDRYCHECFFFENETRFGRKNRSCRSIGEKPSGVACSAFVEAAGMPKRAVPDEFMVARALVAGRRSRDGVDPADVENAITGILRNQLVMSRGVSDSVKKALIAVQQPGLEVDVDPAFMREFERDVDRVLSLWSLYTLANALGIPSFADDLVHARMAQMFPSLTPAAPQSQAAHEAADPVEPAVPHRKRMTSTGEVFRAKPRGRKEP